MKIPQLNGLYEVPKSSTYLKVVAIHYVDTHKLPRGKMKITYAFITKYSKDILHFETTVVELSNIQHWKKVG